MLSQEHHRLVELVLVGRRGLPSRQPGLRTGTVPRPVRSLRNPHTHFPFTHFFCHRFTLATPEIREIFTITPLRKNHLTVETVESATGSLSLFQLPRILFNITRFNYYVTTSLAPSRSILYAFLCEFILSAIEQRKSHQNPSTS